MKKIFSILSTLLVVVLGLGLGACQKDKYEVEEDTFKVLASEISDSKAASVGSIQVSEGDFKFEVSAPWVTLRLKDATNLELSISENPTIEMRSCLVTLTKGTTRINVPVHQMGQLNFIKDLISFTLPAGGGEQSFTVYGSDPVVVETDVDWISHKVEGDKLTLTLKPSNVLKRQAKVRVQTGAFKDELMVTQQLFFDELLGDYTLYYKANKDGEYQTSDARLVKTGDRYALHGAAVPIPVSVNPQTFTLTALFGEQTSKPADVPEGHALYITGWGGGFPGADGKANNSIYLEGEESNYIATWDSNVANAKFTFRSAKENGLARGMIIFTYKESLAWYNGVNGVNALIDAYIVRKSN